MTMNLWRDDLAESRPMGACLSCSKTTKSHVLLITWSESDKNLRPTTSIDDALIVANVCHDCYEAAESNSQIIVRDYEHWLRSECAAVGVSLSDFVDDPKSLLDRIDDQEGDDDQEGGAEPADDWELEDVPDSVPDYIVDALPVWALEMHAPSEEMIVMEYEERFVDVNFETRSCSDCGSTGDHQVTTDEYRDLAIVECGQCNYIWKTELETFESAGTVT